MSAARGFLVFSLVSALAGPAYAGEEADDSFGSVLALVQQFVRLAAQSPDPQVVQKGVDSILAGENAEANRHAARVFEEMLSDFPPGQRDLVASIGRDLLTIARREQAKTPHAHWPGSDLSDAQRAIQARKELHAMGLRYWDEQQFLEAARRGDRIAVELYLAARGLEPRNREIQVPAAPLPIPRNLPEGR
jgi:hypothetical protein